jgi:hypothetical protein
VAEWDIAVKKVTAYSGSGRSQHILKSLTALADRRNSDSGNEIQVVASVRVPDSAFSYAQLAYMLQVAVAGGDFDTQLHNYAAYLHLSTATDATAASVSTEQQRSEDSGDAHHRSRGSVPGLSVTAIVLIVLFTVGAGAVWYYYDYATFKRTCLLCGPRQLLPVSYMCFYFFAQTALMSAPRILWMKRPSLQTVFFLALARRRRIRPGPAAAVEDGGGGVELAVILPKPVRLGRRCSLLRRSPAADN